jgi:hypothetical protein
MPWLISLVTGAGGQVILKLLPYILIITAVAGAYLYGHHRGTVACRDKELQAVIEAQNAKMAEIQKQYQDAQKVIGTLTTNNNKVRDITKTISDKIAAIPNQKGCQIDKSVVDLINQARTTTTPGTKK